MYAVYVRVFARGCCLRLALLPERSLLRASSSTEDKSPSGLHVLRNGGRSRAPFYEERRTSGGTNAGQRAGHSLLMVRVRVRACVRELYIYLVVEVTSSYQQLPAAWKRRDRRGKVPRAS